MSYRALMVVLLPLALGAGCALRMDTKAQTPRPAAGAFGVPIQYTEFIDQDGNNTHIPLLPVTFHGAQYLFMLDTGCPGFCVSGSLAEQMSIPGTPVDFEVGGARLHATSARQVRIGLRDVDAALGYDVLRTLIVRIDYPNKTVTFFDEPNRHLAFGAGAAPPAISVDALPDRHELFLPVTVGDSAVPTTAFFDSGAQSKIAAAEHQRLFPQGVAQPGTFTGLGRVSIDSAPTTTVLNSVQAYLSSSEDRGWRSKAPAVLQLGSDVFANRVVTIDYPARRLYFQ